MRDHQARICEDERLQNDQKGKHFLWGSHFNNSSKQIVSVHGLNSSIIFFNRKTSKHRNTLIHGLDKRGVHGSYNVSLTIRYVANCQYVGNLNTPFHDSFSLLYSLFLKTCIKKK